MKTIMIIALAVVTTSWEVHGKIQHIETDTTPSRARDQAPEEPKRISRNLVCEKGSLELTGTCKLADDGFEKETNYQLASAPKRAEQASINLSVECKNGKMTVNLHAQNESDPIQKAAFDYLFPANKLFGLKGPIPRDRDVQSGGAAVANSTAFSNSAPPVKDVFAVTSQDALTGIDRESLDKVIDKWEEFNGVKKSAAHIEKEKRFFKRLIERVRNNEELNAPEKESLKALAEYVFHNNTDTLKLLQAKYFDYEQDISVMFFGFAGAKRFESWFRISPVQTLDEDRKNTYQELLNRAPPTNKAQYVIDFSVRATGVRLKRGAYCVVTGNM